MSHVTLSPELVTLSLEATVGALVASKPARSRIFEQLGIDYCCGGKIPLAEACQKKGLDPQATLRMLGALDAVTASATSTVDPANLTLSALADHIVQTHHAYLRTELPRLDTITEKVARVHGQHDPRLVEVRAAFVELAEEMTTHMAKEENVLFPMIRQLEASRDLTALHCGSLAHPIQQMEKEHESAGGGLARMRELSDNFTPPVWGCNTYRAMLDGLSQLEQDLHQHVHKENNILFPQALALEAQLRV